MAAHVSGLIRRLLRSDAEVHGTRWFGRNTSRSPRRESRLLWVCSDDSPPHSYLVESARRAGSAVRDVHWAIPLEGERALGRLVEFGDRTGQAHPMSVKLVSPRMLLEFARSPEDVLVIYEFGLVGLYAGLSKLFRPHKVISLVEGDYRHIGRTGNAFLKVVVRRLAARFVDVFVANNPPAREYLIRTLHVPEDKIIVGWWLAGMPADLAAHPPAAAPARVPLFVCAGRLIPQKGTDLVIRALAGYRRRFGPCVLWIIGDGPERESLVRLCRRLGVEDAVIFLGTVDHQALKGAFQACQAFVFPSLQDFTGRVVVEALSAGAPVVASPMTGAVGTIVHDGVNGIVVDPRDASALAEAMHRAADPDTSRALREGVRRTSPALRPEAASQVVLSAVAQARAATPRRMRSKPSAEAVHGRPDTKAAVQTADASADQVLNLRAGEIVEVRSEAEILATLDGRGELESLPFMPEMLQFCGRRFRVDKVAVKLCDTIGSTGMYRMRNAVHLAGVRCDGQAHGGCQAGCLIYWKEAWLRRVPAAEPGPAPASGCTLATVTAASRRPADPAVPGEERFACQATELLRAAPEQVPAWDGRQYVQDVRSGNAGTLGMIRTLGVGLFNEYQDASRRLLPRPLRIRAGRRYPFIEGRLQKTPAETLGLQPGERVRVRRREEIVATLDTNNANRGMLFDGEMLRYCGQEARVLRRVERIIDEKSGRMMRFKNPCIVLDDVTCVGAYHRLCPRGIYPYWREIWLERVE
jgi:glycosyltransferase involved in cell wall biosynthesis